MLVGKTTCMFQVTKGYEIGANGFYYNFCYPNNFSYYSRYVYSLFIKQACVLSTFSHSCYSKRDFDIDHQPSHIKDYNLCA